MRRPSTSPHGSSSGSSGSGGGSSKKNGSKSRSSYPAAPSADFSPSQAFHLSRPILGSLTSLGALLLVVASPLSGVYLLESVVLTRVGDDGRDRWERGGVGVWGGCVRDGGSFLSQSCSLSLPFPAASASSAASGLLPSSLASAAPSSLPSFPTLLPQSLSLALVVALVGAFGAALTTHVFNSYILWGSLSELGRPEGSAVHTPAGRLRFGEGRWRRKWRERVRKVGLFGVGSCAVACAVILSPLLPTFYIPSPISNASLSSSGAELGSSRPTNSAGDDIPISLLLTPSWGLLLLVAAGALMVHSKDSRGLRHGRRGSSVCVGGSSGVGGQTGTSGKANGAGGSSAAMSRGRGSSIDYNLPKTSSPLASSPVRPSPPRSPLVLSPQPRRASLNAQASAPWITGRGSLLTEEAGELGDTDDDGGPTGGNMTTPFEETEDEREVWTWSKEV